jgi:hypothetical protein
MLRLPRFMTTTDLITGSLGKRLTTSAHFLSPGSNRIEKEHVEWQSYHGPMPSLSRKPARSLAPKGSMTKGVMTYVTCPNGARDSGPVERRLYYPSCSVVKHRYC